MRDADRLPSIMHAIFAMKNIERVGDYVTKLARLVYYIVSGERAPKMSEMKRSPISRLDSDDDT
jgi:phosphate uptake regulator